METAVTRLHCSGLTVEINRVLNDPGLAVSKAVEDKINSGKETALGNDVGDAPRRRNLDVKAVGGVARKILVPIHCRYGNHPVATGRKQHFALARVSGCRNDRDALALGILNRIIQNLAGKRPPKTKIDEFGTLISGKAESRYDRLQFASSTIAHDLDRQNRSPEGDTSHAYSIIR